MPPRKAESRFSPEMGMKDLTRAGGGSFDPKSFDWEGNRQTVQDRDRTRS